MSTILVIEDNKDNMDLIKEILEDAGYEIFGTETAENGIEILNRGIKVDIILMDVSLPKLDGYEATRRIKENPRLADIPVIMLTAHAMEEDRDKGFEAGCNDFLTKPVDEELLLQTLAKYL
ncbi:MAG: response regulator [Candidatus Omnitrophica bacterium]|nr:response regulator [Candidatus Omnitrophota bacterium]